MVVGRTGRSAWVRWYLAEALVVQCAHAGHRPQHAQHVTIVTGYGVRQLVLSVAPAPVQGTWKSKERDNLVGLVGVGWLEGKGTR